MGEERRGYLYGLIAYLLWGVFPLYFKLLKPSPPLEILAHRVLWSVLVVALLLTALRSWRFLPGLVRNRRALGGVVLAAVLIGINWGVYIYGVNSDRVVETALGYFINPLVTVVLGVTVLRERLRRWQWAAVGIGLLAVVVLTVDYGRPPWIALTLAFSFGSYGLVKKQLHLPPAGGLFVESAVLAVPLIVFLGFLTASGGAEFGRVSTLHTVLMVGSGLATAIPLLCFASAANRISLTGLGILQYLTPTLQLGFGVLLFHEPMPPARLAGFALVWCALIVFTADAIAATRSRRRAATGPSAATADPATALSPAEPLPGPDRSRHGTS
jgi:chloramphenicol-sensitive protein RarD